MNKRSIYLRSISCKGIKSPIPFQTPSLYATVSLSTTSQRHQTPVDTANGENPEWDCPMRFNLSSTTPSDGQDQFLQFNLKTQVPVLGDRLVGTASVPVSDLTKGGSNGHVGYQVLWPDGKANGTIQLWYQMEGSEILPPRDDMPYSYSSPEPSAPPAANFSYNYKPHDKPGSVYPPSVSGPGYYPQMPSSTAAYSSEPMYPGSIEPGRVYGTHAASEYMPHPLPSSSGLYPPPDSGFGSMAPCYPPPRTDQSASISTCYPPPGNNNPPMNHAESGSGYYPPPGTRYPPSLGSDCCCDGEYGKAQEPVVAYPPANGYYPPPPRYPYY